MAELPKSLPPDVAAALARGNLIEAIKLLRTKYNVGLAEAKALLEALQKQATAGAAASAAATAATRAKATVHVAHAHAVLPPSMTDPHLSPGEVPRTSGAAAFAAVLVVIAFAIGAAVYFSG